MESVHLNLAKMLNTYLHSLPKSEVNKFLFTSGLSDFYSLQSSEEQIIVNIDDLIHLNGMYRFTYLLKLNEKTYLVEYDERNVNPTIFGKLVRDHKFEELESTDYRNLFLQDEEGNLHSFFYFHEKDYEVFQY